MCFYCPCVQCSILGFLLNSRRKKKNTVKVLETTDAWFGVTYKEDQPGVLASIRALIDQGMYRSDLYSDLG